MYFLRLERDAQRGGDRESTLGTGAGEQSITACSNNKETERKQLAHPPDGQSKGNGPTQSGKHKHVLKPKADFLCSPKVEQEGEDINVNDTTSKDGHLCIAIGAKEVILKQEKTTPSQYMQSKTPIEILEFLPAI